VCPHFPQQDLPQTLSPSVHTRAIRLILARHDLTHALHLPPAPAAFLEEGIHLDRFLNHHLVEVDEKQVIPLLALLTAAGVIHLHPDP
jgi:hypothetical protein